MLFQTDLNPDVSGRIIREMIAERLSDADIQDFCWTLFAGTMEHRADLDGRIQQVAENWKLNRMAATDRAVLRLGAFELTQTATPVGVVIDEAVELAKKFGSRQSPQFVNGILDRLIPAERRRPRRVTEKPDSTETSEAISSPEADSRDQEEE